MTLAELMSELVSRKALIVHCSSWGKREPPFFPDDLRNAPQVLPKKDICCSVVWPARPVTTGSVGIILRPRSLTSITSVAVTDAGSSPDPATGRRLGLGRPFSRKAFDATFSAGPGEHNEWTVMDADVVGVFVRLDQQHLEVPMLTDPTQAQGYEPSMGPMPPEPGGVYVTMSDVVTAFPKNPVFGFHREEIVRVDSGPYVGI
jgi:hypothetical protein